MAQNPEPKKSGRFRWFMLIGGSFVLVLLLVVGKYFWQGAVDEKLVIMVATIVGAILSNIDRITKWFTSNED